MKEFLLVFCIIGMFILGYFVMKRLDSILEENRKTIEKEDEIREPSYIMLDSDLSDEEITEEILRFRTLHKKIIIILCSSAGTELSEAIEHQSEKNR